MSAESEFHALLSGHAPLAALVGGHIARNAIQQGPSAFVVYASVHAPVYGLNGELHADQVTFSVQCWARTASGADAVADEVVAALSGAGAIRGATVLERADAHDAETGLDCVSLSIEWWQ